MTSAPHLVFIGDVGGPETFHVGDEAMMEANLDAFRALVAGLTATVVSRDPAWTSRLYQARAVPPLGFPGAEVGVGPRRDLLERLIHSLQGGDWRVQVGGETIAAVAASDGVVVSGGGNLSASWPEHVYERAALCEVAHAFGKPVVFLGQTIGPALCGETAEVLARALFRAQVVGVRELPSAGAALALGVPPERLLYQTDDALFLEPCPVEAAWAAAFQDGGAPWIAVTLDAFLAVPAAAASLDALAVQLTQLATQAKGRLVFLPHVAGPPSDPHSDALAGQALAARLPPDVPLLVCDVLTPRQTRWLTGQADLVVSTRYHPLLFGLAAGVPGVGIVVDEYRRVKLQGALAHAGLGEYCLPLTEAAEGGLLAAGLSLWDRRAEIRGDLARHMQRWRQDAGARWRAVLSALRLRPAGPDDCPVAPGNLSDPLTLRLLEELEARRRFADLERKQDQARHEAEVAALRHTIEEAESYARSLAEDCRKQQSARSEAERYAQLLAEDCDKHRAARAEAEQYARSLAEDREKQLAARAEAEQYARSLEEERGKLRALSA